MRVASITWDHRRDISKVVFADGFLMSDPIVHADVLQDLIAILEDAYETSVKNLTAKNKMPIKKEIKL